MKRWQDDALILHVQHHSEHAGVAYVLSHQHGLYSGFVHGWRSKRQRGIWQPGTIVRTRWQARLDEHLGYFTSSASHAPRLPIYHHPRALAALSSALSLARQTLSARQPEPHMFVALTALCHHLQATPDKASLLYACWEYDFLALMGFGMNLARCASGKPCPPQELIYISPKSGHAVSKQAGAPWRDKLLPLPPFLRHYAHNEALPATVPAHHIEQALHASGLFIQKYLYRQKALPKIRELVIKA
ncbi:MAG: DNA repair protein RecO [Alphaproteobacteria bacterium GM202ARS2]|nr:DNA repair protein RecO [Alphaproteobacteria bacterium GM202ARS2]